MDHVEHCALVATEVERLAEASRDIDPTATVTTCGRWRPRTLFHHVGQLHDWVTRMVSTGSTTRLSRKAADYPIPDDPARWPGWIEAGGGALVAALRDADPDDPVWTWGPDKHVRWWSRRMVHETGVHRIDADLVRGVEPAVDIDVAVDGVDEFLANLQSAARWAWDVRKLRGEHETIALVATDRPVAWRITLEPDRFSWERAAGPSAADPSAAGPVRATVTGSAADLYLYVWGRRPLAGDGDAALLGRWRKYSAI